MSMPMGGHAQQPYLKFNRVFGRDKPEYPTPQEEEDYKGLNEKRLMFKKYDAESYKPGFCPHCKVRGHFIDTCPIREQEKFTELQNINALKVPTPVKKKPMKTKFKALE